MLTLLCNILNVKYDHYCLAFKGLMPTIVIQLGTELKEILFIKRGKKASPVPKRKNWFRFQWCDDPMYVGIGAHALWKPYAPTHNSEFHCLSNRLELMVDFEAIVLCLIQTNVTLKANDFTENQKSIIGTYLQSFKASANVLHRDYLEWNWLFYNGTYFLTCTTFFLLLSFAVEQGLDIPN